MTEDVLFGLIIILECGFSLLTVTDNSGPLLIYHRVTLQKVFQH